jgi:hypothetical protein
MEENGNKLQYRSALIGALMKYDVEGGKYSGINDFINLVVANPNPPPPPPPPPIVLLRLLHGIGRFF